MSELLNTDFLQGGDEEIRLTRPELRAMPTTIIQRIDAMPAHARVWVYKSALPFTDEQRTTILERGDAFTSTWAAHGAPLDACVDVLHDHFVIIAVDEEQAAASGCGIDKSVRFVKDLEHDLGITLTDRMVVLYERNSAIAVCRIPELEGLLKTGTMDADTVVFDDLVGTVADLRARFRVKLRDSWMARYL